MIKLAPVLLALLMGFLTFKFSAWRTSKELAAKSTELADPRLVPLIKDMAKALDIDRIRVHIYEIEPVNGLAAPDGKIYLTRGFYQRYRNGDVTAEEIASVIAHELGHVALGHARRRMIDFSGQNALRTALAMVLNRFLPGLGALLSGAALSLLMARLSRADEFEADAYAAALLVKAGIGTAPQKSLFDKLAHLTGAHGAATPAWLMSHPKVEARIQAIEALEQKWGLTAS